MKKTHSGAYKMLEVTAKRKVKYKKAFLRHLLSNKNETQKRHLKQRGVLKDCDAQNILKLLPFA